MVWGQKIPLFLLSILYGVHCGCVCEPEISENSEAKELECEAESDIKAPIVWMDGHGKPYRGARTEAELLSAGYKLRSSLKSMEIKDEKICCSVSSLIDGVYTGKKACVSNTWVFDPKCSEETCGCGGPVTITCAPTHPLGEVSLKYHNEVLLHGDFLKEEKLVTEDKEIGLEWTEDKVKVTISKVMLSDARKYNLTMVTKEPKGSYEEPIAIKVTGICEPEISENRETEELECEAESEVMAPIVWMNNHRKLYRAAGTMEPEPLDTGYKMRSSLRLTEEIGDDICCSVSYRIDGVNTEKKTCIPNTSARDSEEPPRSTNPSLSLVLTLLAVALVAAAFGYLLKRRSRIIVRETPEEQKPTEPETV